MKRVVFIFFLLIPLIVQGQKKQVVVRSFEQADLKDARAWNFDPDQNGLRPAAIEISMPVTDPLVRFEGTAGIPVQGAGYWLVPVAEGSKQIRISIPGCTPFNYDFPQELKSGRVYEMTLKIVESLTLLLPLFSYTTSQPSYGIMAGHLWKGHGVYLKAKTNFTFGLNPTTICDGAGMIDGVKGWFTGASKSSRLSVTGGYLGKLYQNYKNFGLYVYGGGGWGQRILAWEAYGADGQYEYVKVGPYSYQGWEMEAGLVLRIKSIALMGGVQTNQFKHVEANVGIGLMW